MTIKQQSHITTTFTQHGDNSTQQQIMYANNEVADPLDELPDGAMYAFIRATAQALDSLRLDQPLHTAAQTTLDEIRGDITDTGSGGSRLAALAGALRNVLEQAGGNLLSAALLGLWHP